MFRYRSPGRPGSWAFYLGGKDSIVGDCDQASGYSGLALLKWIVAV